MFNLWWKVFKVAINAKNKIEMIEERVCKAEVAESNVTRAWREKSSRKRKKKVKHERWEMLLCFLSFVHWIVNQCTVLKKLKNQLKCFEVNYLNELKCSHLGALGMIFKSKPTLSFHEKQGQVWAKVNQAVGSCQVVW